MNFSFDRLPITMVALCCGIVSCAMGQDCRTGSESIYQKNEFLRTLIEQRVKAGGGVSTVQVTGAGAPRNTVKLDFISQRERRERVDLGYGSIQSPAGTYGVEGHGNSGAMFFRTGEAFSAQELARWIRRDSRYRTGMPIYLFACETGKGSRSFAQRLADVMGATVMAPTEKLWISTGGGYYIAAEEEKRLLGFIPASTQRADRTLPGSMKAFRPSGR